MAKLHQVVAVVSGKKKRVEEVKTECYHKVQKAPLFDGISKTYQPKNEDGDRLPSESKDVQVKVSDMVADFTNALTELIDVVATQDVANCNAKGDIKVDGTNFVLQNIPVTHLMWLDHQL